MTRALFLATVLAFPLLGSCVVAPPAAVGARSYQCQQNGGCNVVVNGAPAYYGYGAVVPVACAGVVVMGCGGPVVAACGAVASCGAVVVSCGVASCGGASCGGCGGCG